MPAPSFSTQARAVVHQPAIPPCFEQAPFRVFALEVLPSLHLKPAGAGAAAGGHLAARPLASRQAIFPAMDGDASMAAAVNANMSFFIMSLL